MSTGRLLCALALAAATLHAQSLPDLGGYAEPPSSTTFDDEFVLVDLGDLDGDGLDDYGVVGGTAPTVLLGGTSFIHHSTTGVGTFLHETFPVGGSRRAARIFSLPDLDGNSLPEVAYVMPVAFPMGSSITEVRIASGLTLAPIATIPLASVEAIDALSPRFAAIGDQTGDGVIDFVLSYVSLVSVFGPVHETRIDLIDGVTFTPSPLASFSNVQLTPGGLVTVGDVDGDGVTDFVSSSPETSYVVSQGGSATLFSGASGIGLRNWLGMTAGEKLGSALAPLDDIDGDGRDDVAILAAGTLGAGRVSFFSTGTGLALHVIDPPVGSVLRRLLAAGDMDGDGTRDVVIELEDLATGARVREVRSGDDVAVIATIPASHHPVGDLNGDRIADRIEVDRSALTFPGAPVYRGRALLGAQSYGTGVGGRLLRWLPFASVPAAGVLQFSGATPGTPLLGAISLQPAATTIFGTPFPLLISPAPQDLLATFGYAADAAGGHADFIDMRVPALAGLVIYMQFAELGVNPGTSNAVEMMFGPTP
ncbi:MAG: hypothetical protein R3F20_00285 [Planctomycetota bacterium]